MRTKIIINRHQRICLQVKKTVEFVQEDKKENNLDNFLMKKVGNFLFCCQLFYLIVFFFCEKKRTIFIIPSNSAWKQIGVTL